MFFEAFQWQTHYFQTHKSQEVNENIFVVYVSENNGFDIEGFHKITNFHSAGFSFFLLHFFFGDRYNMQSKRQFQDQSGSHYKGLSTANGWI